MSRPLLLDLYCKAGGAAMGYHRAGFDVVGVDISPQPNYPFAYYRHDALDFLTTILNADRSDPWFAWANLAAIHASPPCQASCALIKGNQRATAGNHVDLIPQTRELLARTGLPTVIENVQGAVVRRDLTLCGEMFGLGVIRHRYFECSFPVVQPPHVKHRGRVAGWRHGQKFDGPYWTDVRAEIAEAIPPAYTEHVGAQLLAAINQLTEA